jgi:hypothetical protein
VSASSGGRALRVIDRARLNFLYFRVKKGIMREWLGTGWHLGHPIPSLDDLKFVSGFSSKHRL